MNKIKELDLRELQPQERHKQIFEIWNSLKIDESMRIINDHDPTPLKYQFEAEEKGNFEWNFEEQGPKDWIFTIKKVSVENNKKEDIKSLLKGLNSKEDAQTLKEKGKGLLKDISATDLAPIEQELIEEGTTRDEMRKLCDVHLEVMKDNLEKKEVNLKPGHPIHTLMEEHKMILEFLDKLEETVDKLKEGKNFEDVKNEIEMLEHISEHLVEADSHHKREEDVLFSALRKHAITEPPQIMIEDHEKLRPMKKKIYNLALNHEGMSYEEFLKEMSSAAEFVISELPDHIYKEDNILYSMALSVINDEEWAHIKQECDKIGYCCFTPKA